MGAYQRKFKDEAGKVVKDPQWRYRCTFTAPDGSKVSISGTPAIDTAKAARAAEKAHIERVLNPSKVENVGTFANFWVKRWWPTVDGTPSTREAKDVHYRNHLEPELGDIKLTDIKAETVAKLRKSLEAKGLSDKSARNVLTTLHKALEDAHSWQCIATVPDFPKIKVADGEWDYFDRDELILLLSNARDATDRLLLHFAAKTGARAGEQLALEWQDIDWRRATVRFRRSRTRGITGPTKSKHHRDVPLTAALLSELRALQSVSKKQRLVFQRDGAEMLIGQLHEVLWRTVARAELREIRWHDLRHSFASNLIAAGVPILQVQQWLGHATLQMTMRYAHLAPNTNNHLIALLDEAPRERKIAAVG